MWHMPSFIYSMAVPFSVVISKIVVEVISIQNQLIICVYFAGGVQVTDGGSLNLLSRSCAEYNINELGLQKRRSATLDDRDAGDQEKTYQCASSEMCVFGAIGWGASSVVRKAIHIPTHRILALKKINVFEKASKHLCLHGYCTSSSTFLQCFCI